MYDVNVSDTHFSRIMKFFRAKKRRDAVILEVNQISYECYNVKVYKNEDQKLPAPRRRARK